VQRRSIVSLGRGCLTGAEARTAHLLGQVHVLLAQVPVVVGGGGTVGEVTGTEDQDVVSSTERIREDGTGPLQTPWGMVNKLTYVSRHMSGRSRAHQKDIRIVTGSLLGGRSIEVPLLQLLDVRDLAGEGHGLASHSTGTINPDVCIKKASLVSKLHVGRRRDCGTWEEETHTRP
jgi:hypothetical protein